MKKLLLTLGLFLLTGNYTVRQFEIIDYWSDRIDGVHRIKVVDEISSCGRPVPSPFESFYGCYRVNSNVVEVWNKSPHFEFTLLHELGHDSGIVKEHLANNYAYEHIFSRYGRLKYE